MRRFWFAGATSAGLALAAVALGGCAVADAAGQAVQRRLQDPAVERGFPGAPRDV